MQSDCRKSTCVRDGIPIRCSSNSLWHAPPAWTQFRGRPSGITTGITATRCSPGGPRALVRRHDFSSPPLRHPRAARRPGCRPGVADVDGTVLRVIVTHLSLPPAERRYQVKLLLSLLHPVEHGQIVVALGDINEWLPLHAPCAGRMKSLANRHRSVPFRLGIRHGPGSRMGAATQVAARVARPRHPRRARCFRSRSRSRRSFH